MHEILKAISDVLWGWPMIILLLGTHIFLTIRLKVPQRKIFKGIKLSVTRDKDSSGDVSQFGALATSLAATIGTGNIIGVAIAVTIGGPGAVLWCWLSGLFGIATKYGEGLLAILYRTKNEKGEMCGGPMYALENGLNMKWLAVIFCICTALAAFGLGSTVQANAISTLLHESYQIPMWISGLVVTFLVTLVLVFGVKGISNVCSTIVPFMALLYVLGCVYIICLNCDYLLPTLKLIISSAFHAKAAAGGFVGTSVMVACRLGISRGLFSNESGLGSAPIIAAAARTKNPVRQALVSSTGTFWDTVVVCALTGIALVSSILAYPEINSQNGAVITQMAFSKIPYVGDLILSTGIFFFAITTILGWAYYSQKAVEYLTGLKGVYIYRAFFIISVFLGCLLELQTVWELADVVNALMAIPNIISLLLLSGVMARVTQKYLWENRLDEDCGDDFSADLMKE